ncbi:hypothetical protein D1Q00_gp040 [Trichoplusia ni granulovirus LBIV-12]|uniref:Uncharacterized protein n=2 Tax=Betabaculovirus TaxID=558017 RepID=A0A1D8QL59_GVTN|nr:hypothetical protein PsunGV_gp046 [Pseudalatia unipuncta granulovirus]YP_009506110.1 hypothetical protein D1Q00_gp040 [Trichoplusia ni granulovirus LBIV-12]ACH69396.1 unknown [Pseudalatia unipuncta granulovirus]AOW41379.1 hypothetical protein [Trichoplusia ni granulovirus LBIV-12]
MSFGFTSSSISTTTAGFVFLRDRFLADRTLASNSLYMYSRFLICSSVNALFDSSKMDLICFNRFLSEPVILNTLRSTGLGFNLNDFCGFGRSKNVIFEDAFSYQSSSSCDSLLRELPPYLCSSMSTYASVDSLVFNRFSLG